MALDIGPYLAPIVTVLLAFGAFYAATMAKFARMETRIDAVERVNANINTLANQLTALSTKLDDLREDVSRHNNLIERTYKLESDMKTQWNRVDELRADLHDVKVGGSK